jgi:23S rRNA (guanosine2251-2'-O)-methyltransferase
LILSRLHPIEEAVRSRPEEIEWVLLDSQRRDRRLGELARLCRAREVPLRYGDREALDRLARGNQGAVARIAVRGYASEEEVLAGDPGRRLVIVLDGVEDPQNLGAIIRSAHALGAHGVVVPRDRAAGVTPAVAKASAGAVERLAVARVTNVAQCLAGLKEAGVWSVALAADGERLLASMDLTGPTALVLGGEGEGLRPLVRRTCDFSARIPMKGDLDSLSVAASAAVALYEAARQRGG